MPIQFQCQSCQSTLRVPDNLAGRKVKCPKCGGVADVGPSNSGPASSARQPVSQAQDIPIKSSPQPLAEPLEVRVRSRKPVPVQKPEDEDWDVLEDQPSRSARSKSRRGEAISARPLDPPPPVQLEDEDEEDDVPRPRPFKRRRRNRPRKRSLAGWGWTRWLVAAVIYVVVGAGISIHMVITDHVQELIQDAVIWAVMMPISVIILIGSMFIASFIAGGIDFGDARTAIPKAFFLLAPINFISAAFPWFVSMFATLPFWIFGLILLFGLDVWETIFLMVVNWFLGTGAKILIGLIVLAMLFRAATMDMEEPPADDGGDEHIEAPIKNPPPNVRRLGR